MNKTKHWKQQRHLARCDKSKHRKAIKPQRQVGYISHPVTTDDIGLFNAIFGRLMSVAHRPQINKVNRRLFK